MSEDENSVMDPVTIEQVVDGLMAAIAEVELPADHDPSLIQELTVYLDGDVDDTQTLYLLEESSPDHDHSASTVDTIGQEEWDCLQEYFSQDLPEVDQQTYNPDQQPEVDAVGSGDVQDDLTLLLTNVVDSQDDKFSEAVIGDEQLRHEFYVQTDENVISRDVDIIVESADVIPSDPVNEPFETYSSASRNEACISSGTLEPIDLNNNLEMNSDSELLTHSSESVTHSSESVTHSSESVTHSSETVTHSSESVSDIFTPIVSSVDAADATSVNDAEATGNIDSSDGESPQAEQQTDSQTNITSNNISERTRRGCLTKQECSAAEPNDPSKCSDTYLADNARLVEHDSSPPKQGTKSLAGSDQGTESNGSDNEQLQNSSDPCSGQRPYTCKTCSKTFASRAKLERHTKSLHMNMTQHECGLCGKSFSTDVTYKTHMYSHKGGESLTCHLCSKKFSKRQTLRIHVTNHSGYKPQVCHLCGHECVLESDLNMHMEKHAEHSQQLCSVCGKSFKNIRNLKLHMLSHEKLFVCDVCGKRLPSAAKLKLHIRQHSGEKPHQCGTCQKAFIDVSSLKKHETCHAQVKSYSCTECGSDFKSIMGLRVHMKKHVEAASQRECPICGKLLATKAGLKQHVSCVHKNNESHVCDECGQGFSRAGLLKAHVGRIHDTSQEQPCPECGIMYMYPPDLQKHLRKHYNRTHLCPSCSKSFPSKYELSMHMHIHTGEKPHCCQVCGKSFRLSSQLRLHTMMHTGEKPHSCEVCGKAFRTSGKLKDHMRTHKEPRVHSCNRCRREFVEALNLEVHLLSCEV